MVASVEPSMGERTVIDAPEVATVSEPSQAPDGLLGMPSEGGIVMLVILDERT